MKGLRRPPSLLLSFKLRRDSLRGLPSRSGRSPRRLVLSGFPRVLVSASMVLAATLPGDAQGRITNAKTESRSYTVRLPGVSVQTRLPQT